MIKAYINTNAISCYNNVVGQVEIYDTKSDDVEWESYKTTEEMTDRVNYINSLKATSFKEL